MIIERELKNFKVIFDKEMERVLDLKIIQAKKISPWAVSFAEDFKNYMLAGGGGKRIRPALMYFGYLMLGGKNKKDMIMAAMSVEFLHACFLIQDDIIDRDDLRHREKTMHCRYNEWAKKKLKLDNTESYHYGISQAIILADIALEMSYNSLIKFSCPEKIKVKAVGKLNEIVFNTAVGEMSDVLAEKTKSVSESQTMNILEYKTARYTVEGPLHLGAIMAGADEKILKSLSDFAIPLGIAFQIQDDILGVFGSSAETGKPVGADIREGKKTLLIVKVLEAGSSAQKKEMISILGNSRISAAQIERARQIIIDSGSLEYSRKLAEKLIYKADKAIQKSGFDSQGKEFFTGVENFIVKRNH